MRFIWWCLSQDQIWEKWRGWKQMDLIFLLGIPSCKCIVAENPYSTATYLYNTIVCSGLLLRLNTTVDEWKQKWKQSSCFFWKGGNRWSKEKISSLSSPRFLLPSNRFPLGSLRVVKKLHQRSHLIIVLLVLFILSFSETYFHFLGP